MYPQSQSLKERLGVLPQPSLKERLNKGVQTTSDFFGEELGKSTRKLVAGGLPRLFGKEAAPSTFGQAFKERQDSMSILDESGKINPEKAIAFAGTFGPGGATKPLKPVLQMSLNVDSLIEEANKIRGGKIDLEAVEILEELKDKIVKGKKISKAEERLFNILADGFKRPDLKHK